MTARQPKNQPRRTGRPSRDPRLGELEVVDQRALLEAWSIIEEDPSSPPDPNEPELVQRIRRMLEAISDTAQGDD
jgi:hypothetical protein